MGPEDILAILAPLVAMVLVAVMVLTGYRHRLHNKARRLELIAGHTAEKAAQYASHVQRLEARVRVLERIATDKGAGFATVVEDLRDPALN